MIGVLPYSGIDSILKYVNMFETLGIHIFPILRKHVYIHPSLYLCQFIAFRLVPSALYFLVAYHSGSEHLGLFH